MSDTRAKLLTWYLRLIGTMDCLALPIAFIPRSWIASSHGAMGLGMLLYFASQGSGRMLWPVLAGTLRLVLAALFGWVAVAWLGFGEPALFALVAAAAAAFGAVNAASMLWGAWGTGSSVASSPRGSA